MRSQVSNQKSFSKDEEFMHSIYNKVSTLRQNLESYQKDSPAVKNSYDQNRNSQTKLHIKISKMKTFNFQPKLSLVTLNDHSKINRQSHLLKLRFQNKTQDPFSKTILGFSSTYRHNQKQIQMIQINSKQRSLSSFNLTGNSQFNKTKDFSKSSIKTQFLLKRHFSSKQLHSKQQTSRKQNKFPHKIEDGRVERGRTQNKINRISRFLSKYDNISCKNVQIKQGKKQNKDMTMGQSQDVAPIEEVTKQNNNIEDQFKVLDSDKNSDNFHAIQSLKQERRGLEDRKNFKPIGSANGLKRSMIKNQCIKNSDHEQNLGARELNQVKEKPNIIIHEGISSSDRQSALRKNYLEKGNRFRQILYKKLLKQDPDKHEQMIYVKQYDQWVPSKLIQHNRKELQTYMKMLLGQKKQHKNSQKLSLQNIDLLYY